MNHFGENVSVEEVERAVLDACRRGHAEIVEFTVAPRCPSAGEPRGGHEWLIEFAEPPRAPETFARALDEMLQRLNAGYRTTRAGDVAMIAPRVLELPAGTFYRWRREYGQHKVPRVTSDRAVADGVLGILTGKHREPLISIGS